MSSFASTFSRFDPFVSGSGHSENMCMRVCVLLVRTRGNMADGEPNPEIAEHLQDLTITEDQNTSIETEVAQEKGAKEEPYNYGFSLLEYYKLCLQYYHRGKMPSL